MNNITQLNILSTCFLAMYLHPVWADENIVPFSVITSTPYVGSSIKYLKEERSETYKEANTLMLDAPLSIMLGRQIKMRYEFKFPKRIRISAVRIYQLKTKGRRWAKKYTLKIDHDGDGLCENEIKKESDSVPDKWMEYRLFNNIYAYKLCFNALGFYKGKGPDYGGPVIGGFEIYTPDSITQSQKNVISNGKQSVTVREDQDNRKAIEKLTAHHKTPWHDKFAKGVFASMWYYWSPSKGYSYLESKNKVNELVKLGANRLWLYPAAYAPHGSGYRQYLQPKDEINKYYINRRNINKPQIRILPFPSVVDTSSKNNILKSLVDQLHDCNIGIIINEQILPYGTNGWDFPRVLNSNSYPSLCSKYIRSQSINLYREIMLSGVDGLVLGGDEFFLYGSVSKKHSNAPQCYENGVKKEICKPECSELFKAWSIKNKVSDIVNTPTTKWKYFQYAVVADWFSEYKKMMSSINDKSIATTLFRAGEQNRLGYGISYDILGSSRSIDEISSDPYWHKNSYLGHYYFSNEVKKLTGANHNRRATVTLQSTPKFNSIAYKNPIMVYGPAFSALMHGVSGINYYKQDYLYKGRLTESGQRVKNVFSLITYLEQQGLDEFSVNKDVALLYSRASEDWWQLKNKGRTNESLKATLTQNAVMEVLFKESIPFELYYLDQPTLLKNLDEYKLVILPFPYSISNQTHELISELVSKGKTVITVNAKGEVDEFGSPHPAPLLSSSKYTHVRVSLDNTNYQNFSNKLLPIIRSSLREKSSLTVNDRGHDLECGVKQHLSKREWLLFCVNWERNKYSALINLAVEDSLYTIDKITPEYIAPVISKTGKIFNKKDFTRFDLEVLPWDTFVLHIKEVEKVK